MPESVVHSLGEIPYMGGLWLVKLLWSGVWGLILEASSGLGIILEAFCGLGSYIRWSEGGLLEACGLRGLTLEAQCVFTFSQAKGSNYLTSQII